MTFCFFGPELLFVVYLPLKGLSRFPHGPHVVSSSLAQDLVLAQSQQKAEEGEEKGSQGAWICWLLVG